MQRTLLLVGIGIAFVLVVLALARISINSLSRLYVTDHQGNVREIFLPDAQPGDSAKNVCLRLTGT